MKVVALLAVVLGLSSPAIAGESEQWLNPFALDMNTAKLVLKIPRQEVVEVAASKLEGATERLAPQPIVPQEPYDAEYFGRAEFSCQAPSRLYLVRAVYTNGSTGGSTCSVWKRRCGSHILH